MKAKDDEVSKLEREIRRLRALEHQNKVLIQGYEKELDLVGKIISSIESSIEKIPPIDPPVFSIYDIARHEEVAVLLMSDVHIVRKQPPITPECLSKDSEYWKRA